MEIFYAVCAGVITASVVVATVFFVKTLVQIRMTARAVEYFVINANDKIEATKELFEVVNTVSNLIHSLWFKAVKLGWGFMSNYKSSRE